MREGAECFAAKIRSGLTWIDVRASPHGAIGGCDHHSWQTKFLCIDKVTGGEEGSCGEIDRGLIVDG
ncbi:MAG: hypothetical protein Tsb008_18380 [Rhodothalassiaceae bacterium]